MGWILLISFALAAVRVADLAGPPPVPGDNIWDTNARLFPSLREGDASSGSTTFKDGQCVQMQGHCLGEDGKTSNLGKVIQIETSSPLVCREECKKNLDIGGCEFKREKTSSGIYKHTCTRFGGPGIAGDGAATAKCWNMLKCGTDTDMKLVEGDIVETQNVKEVRSGKFDAIKNPRYKWLKRGGLVRIPYTMSLGTKAQQRVSWAVKHISANTCVRWVARSNQRDYVSMFNGGGCYSMIGRQGGRQKLSLGAGCLYDSGTTVHEMLHAMGWYHEQSRDDRDSYIKIYWNNIASAMRYNFAKYNGAATTYGLKYDKKSVMQYGNRAFGSGRITMEDIANRNAQLGQRIRMTAPDIASVNIHYGCDCNVYSCKADGTKGGKGGTGKTGGGGNDCADKNENCAGWKERGECEKNPEYMDSNCQKSCEKCPIKPKPTTKPTTAPGNCEDRQPFCAKITSFCTKNAWVTKNCQKSCDKCPRPPTRPPQDCKDLDKNCAAWKSKGYCTTKYVDFMKKTCKKSCGFPC